MNYASVIKLKTQFNKSFEDGNLDDALKLGERIIKDYKKSVLRNTKKYADDLFDIAFVNDEAHFYLRAEKLYQESARIIKRISGKDLSYSYRINNLAVLYSKLERNEEALKLFRESYRIALNILGDRNEVTVDGAYNLGNAYYGFHDYEKAVNFLNISLKSRRKKDGSYIDNLNSLGYAYEALSDYESALRTFHLALSLTGEVDGIISLPYLSGLYYILNIYYEQGKYEKAFDYMDIFANITHKLISQKFERLETGGYLSGYKASFSNGALLNQAEKGLPLSDDMTEHSRLTLSFRMADSAREMKAKKHFNKALSLADNAMGIKCDILGRDNIDYLKDLILYASICYEMGDMGKTLKCISDMLEILEKNGELFEECLTELLVAFTEFDGEDMTEDDKRDFFSKIYNMVENGEIYKKYNWDIFDE